MLTVLLLLGSLLMLAISLACYFFPFLIARHRQHHNQVAILVFNLFLGWTFLGWVVALVWALTKPKLVDPTGRYTIN